MGRKNSAARRLAPAAALILMAVQPARAGLIFSDDFESGNLSLWASNISGSLTADPLSEGHGFVVHFSVAGGGGDLFTPLLAYTDPILLEFDFLQTGTTNSGGYVGTDHQTTPWGQEEWILNTGGAGTYSNLDFLPAGVWNHVSLQFNVYDPSSVGTFSLKLEQVNAGFGMGIAYFDNISVFSGVPEPGTMTLFLAGLGGLAAARLRRKR